MGIPIALDFGTSNTVLAYWDKEKQIGKPYFLSAYTRSFNQGDNLVHVIPSLIHYGQNGKQRIGSQIYDHQLQASRQTFRWMKRYIDQRSPIRVRVADRWITPQQAAEDFLLTIIRFAREEINTQGEQIALTVPVESFEYYEQWLSSLMITNGLTNLKIIDEPSAAALGYQNQSNPGDTFFIIDFGGGTLDTSLVMIQEYQQELFHQRRSRVLGKSGKRIGGATIDQWLYQHLLESSNLKETDPLIQNHSIELLVEIEQIKQELSRSTTSFFKHESIFPEDFEFSRSEFEQILLDHQLDVVLKQTIDQTFRNAQDRGYLERDVKAVLLIGGSSQIPFIHEIIRASFPDKPIFTDHPLTAVACGAAAFAAGVDFYDHIQHDYAIRYVDESSGGYAYQTLVQRGTNYPTHEPVASMTIQAAFDGQTHLGIAIFEMGTEIYSKNEQPFEMIFDRSGSARIMPVPKPRQEERVNYWLNQQSPTFLLADPPAKAGAPRFRLDFYINQNKQLTCTAVDLSSQTIQFSQTPIIQLK